MEDRLRSPSGFERRLLLWYKKYPTAQEIPTLVNRGVIERVRAKFRIHLNIATMVASVFGFAYYSYLGKQAVKEGKGIAEINQEWHKEIDANPNAPLPDIRKGI